MTLHGAIIPSLSVSMFPDAEHSSATAIPALIPTIGGFETNLAGKIIRMGLLKWNSR